MHKNGDKCKKQKLGRICIALGAAAVLAGMCGLLIKGHLEKEPQEGYLQPIRVGAEGGRQPLVSDTDISGQVPASDADTSRQLTIYAENMQGLYNPAFAETLGDQLVSAAAFEPMMQQMGPDDWKPVLLETAERTADGLTYILHLKQGILFWDGTEMKAQDVCASILAYGMAGKEMGKAFAYLSGFEEFIENPEDCAGGYPEGVKPVDDYTVQLRFDKDSGDNRLLLGILVQKDTFIGDNQDGTSLERLNRICRTGIGTGPYQWTKDRETGGEIRLEAVSHYRKKGKGIETILFLSPGTYEAAELAGRGGIDMAVCDNSGLVNDAFYGNESYSVYERPTQDCYCLKWGTTYQMEETKAYRQAVEAAVQPGAYESGRGREQADMQNQQETREGREENEINGEVTLLIDKEDAMQTETAQNLEQMLKAAGVRLNIQPVSAQEYLQAVYERQEYELILTNSTLSQAQADGLVPLYNYTRKIYITGDIKDAKVLRYGLLLEELNQTRFKKR